MTERPYGRTPSEGGARVVGTTGRPEDVSDHDLVEELKRRRRRGVGRSRSLDDGPVVEEPGHNSGVPRPEYTLD